MLRLVRLCSNVASWPVILAIARGVQRHVDVAGVELVLTVTSSCPVRSQHVLCGHNQAMQALPR
jgi:hypothetical protein